MLVSWKTKDEADYLMQMSHVSPRMHMERAWPPQWGEREGSPHTLLTWLPHNSFPRCPDGERRHRGPGQEASQQKAHWRCEWREASFRTCRWETQAREVRSLASRHTAWTAVFRQLTKSKFPLGVNSVFSGCPTCLLPQGRPKTTGLFPVTLCCTFLPT